MRALAWLLAMALLPLLPGAPAQGALGDVDPLLVEQEWFLAAGGAMVREPPPQGAVPAPMASPPEDSVAVWLLDAPAAGSLAGDALLTLRVRVNIPSVAVPPRAAFSAALLVAGERVAREDFGPQALAPGTLEVEVALPAEGASFEEGEGIALEVRYRSLSPGPAPAVEYLVGPDGSRLALRVRHASLDALGHEHGPADRHFLLREHRFRMGDLGNGLWGTDLRIGPAAQEPGSGPPADLVLPAGARRVLLQLYLTPDVAWPEEQPSVGLVLPGGPTTVYLGEVVVREVPAAEPFEVRCTTCGPEPRTVAKLRAEAPTAAPHSEDALATTQARGGARPDAADPQLVVFALIVPAGAMLLAAIWYVMRAEGGPWGQRAEPERSAPPRREPHEQRREEERRFPGSGGAPRGL